MITRTRLTYSAYRALPENDRYEHEMIAGEEFLSPSPSWRHQQLASRLAARLEAFARPNNLGEVVQPVDLYYNETTYVSPH
ncbi:MAG: Uma2 family endonuclease, partial [Chloroflexota bacterium]